jgi:hypothetical protein
MSELAALALGLSGPRARADGTGSAGYARRSRMLDGNIEHAR